LQSTCRARKEWIGSPQADKLTPDALQALMQHKDYQTTQRYINLARQLNPALQNLFVPDVRPKLKTVSE
jgi:hypothetical protein